MRYIYALIKNIKQIKNYLNCQPMDKNLKGGNLLLLSIFITCINNVVIAMKSMYQDVCINSLEVINIILL